MIAVLSITQSREHRRSEHLTRVEFEAPTFGKFCRLVRHATQHAPDYALESAMARA